MEKRRARRRTIHLNAESISGDENFSVFIENLSEEGIYLTTAPAHAIEPFTPETIITLKIKLSSRGLLSLKCRVQWSLKTRPPGSTYRVGMAVIDPPQEYIEFIQSLN